MLDHDHAVIARESAVVHAHRTQLELALLVRCPKRQAPILVIPDNQELNRDPLDRLAVEGDHTLGGDGRVPAPAAPGDQHQNGQQADRTQYLLTHEPGSFWIRSPWAAPGHRCERPVTRRSSY